MIQGMHRVTREGGPLVQHVHDVGCRGKVSHCQPQLKISPRLYCVQCHLHPSQHFPSDKPGAHTRLALRTEHPTLSHAAELVT